MGRKSNTAATAETIAAGVNEGRFIAHMQHLFSSSAVFLAELMQNARRAGATAVHFGCEGNTLAIVDDGCGIADFAKLVVIAESGWSEEVMDSEDPFGIGFASVAFAAKRVTVESRGKGIEFSHQDLVAKTPIAVRNSDFIGGTRVTLHDVAIGDVESRLTKFAMGFPIPVFCNGTELARPHAPENLRDIQNTAVGKIHVARLGIAGPAQLPKRGHVYCQGLPVSAGWFSSRNYRSNDDCIVHIDHGQWKPRVPDRDVLIDADKAASAIVSAVQEVCVSRMESDKCSMPPEAYVERYWGMAREVQRMDLMNDVPALPNIALSVAADYPVDPAFDSKVLTRQGPPVMREQVERGEITLCSSVAPFLEGDSFARLMLIEAMGWVMVERLPAKHWATPHVIDMDALPVRISCKTLATGSFSGWSSGTVKAVENLRLVFARGGKRETVDLAEPVVLGRDSYDVTYLVPRGCSAPANVLEQASSYLDDSQIYQGTSHGLDIDEFTNLCAGMFGERPAETLCKCLVGGNAMDRSNLRGKRFVVAIGEDGKPVVELMSE